MIRLIAEAALSGSGRACPANKVRGNSGDGRPRRFVRPGLECLLGLASSGQVEVIHMSTDHLFAAYSGTAKRWDMRMFLSRPIPYTAGISSGVTGDCN
ncbi:hypothetical protein CFR73_16030 [Novacetimonas maltaceti]|nr:hypothetical protein CFR73_16030 [Novacetimonas maltaceti]